MIFNYSDFVSIYAAIVATIVGIYQVVEWRRAAAAFVVRTEAVGRGNVQFNFQITNTTTRPTQIHWAGVGLGYRSWKAPWKVTIPFSRAIRSTGDGYINFFRMQEDLAAGQRIDGYINRSDFEEIKTSISKRFGFRPRLVVWIDHSGGDKPYRKSIKC